MKWIESVWKSFRLLWFTKRQIFDIDNEPSTSVSHTAWGFFVYFGGQRFQTDNVL